MRECGFRERNARAARLEVLKLAHVAFGGAAPPSSAANITPSARATALTYEVLAVDVECLARPVILPRVRSHATASPAS
jgi:hypothetical protein